MQHADDADLAQPMVDGGADAPHGEGVGVGGEADLVDPLTRVETELMADVDVADATPAADAEAMDALVRRSFGFIDLCGFTQLTDEHGVGQSVNALSTFRAVVRERAGWRGVRIAKWLGDGAMLVATDPRPLLDAVSRMETAMDSRGCALPLRAGLAAGRVILFEGDDYIGRAVNLAARLCDEAEAHQLLVTASLFNAAGQGLRGVPLGPQRVRGFTRAIEIIDFGDRRERQALSGN